MTNEDNFDWETDTWKLVKNLITRPNYLVEHQINSFNANKKELHHDPHYPGKFIHIISHYHKSIII